MEAKLKNIEMVVGMCRKISDIAVIMSIPYKVDKLCLKKLKCNNVCENVYSGSESAALGFALFEVIRDKMVGSPLEVSRSKVSHVNCDAINGKFLITFNTQGSISALRKNVGIILSSLAPHKLYSKYAENMKLLKGKSDRDVFNHCANEMSDAIKKIIQFSVIGKIKVDGAKLKELLGKVEKKLPKQTTEKGTKPEKHKEHELDYPTIKVSGISAIAVADYILSKSGGMGVDILDDKVIVYNKSWPTKQSTLNKAERIKDYVRQKYEKLDKDFPFVLGYSAITRNLADCCTITSLIKSHPTASSMVGLIQKVL